MIKAIAITIAIAIIVIEIIFKINSKWQNCHIFQFKIIIQIIFQHNQKKYEWLFLITSKIWKVKN